MADLVLHKLSINYSPEFQKVDLQFVGGTDGEFKTWDFVLAILNMATEEAKFRQAQARMQAMQQQAMQQQAMQQMEMQAVKQVLGNNRIIH